MLWRVSIAVVQRVSNDILWPSRQASWIAYLSLYSSRAATDIMRVVGGYVALVRSRELLEHGAVEAVPDLEVCWRGLTP